MKSKITAAILTASFMLVQNAILLPSINIKAESKAVLEEPRNSCEEKDVKIHQLQQAVSLFKEALNKFGASSPIQAAELWAEGIKTRNGALQYSVLCDKQKEQFEKEFKDNPSWVTGFSSPWVTKYEIISSEKVDANTYDIKVKFYWATSAGEEKPTESNLVVSKVNDKWCISKLNKPY